MRSPTSTACVCCAWLAGCAGTAPFAPPPVAVVATYAPATQGGGGSGEVVDNLPQDHAKSVRLEVFALRTTPAIGSVEPGLAAISVASGAPFRAASSLPPATRWASPAPPIDGHRVGEAVAVVAPSLVTTFSLAATHLPQVGCQPAGDGVQVFLLTSRDGHAGTERALLRQRLDEATTGMLFVPAPGDAMAGHAIVVSIAGAAAPADADVARTQAAAAAQRAPAPAAATWQARLAADAIGEQPRRAAMLAVAARLELAPCTDILLAADERHLITIGTELAGIDAGADDYAWAFQRAVWTGLVPGLQRDELPPGLRAAVIRRLGSVAAEPAVLQLHLQASADGAAFAAALREENVYALADRDPVYRVQAHDWLAAHGDTVADYDPLAPAADRASALRAHARAESTP